MEVLGLWGAAGKAFLISLVLTPICRDVFRAYDVVDRPGRRKVHAYPIPRVGGIAIMVAYAATLLTFTDFARTPGYQSPVWVLLPGAICMFLVGLIDDFFNLPPLVKLAGQFIAAGLAVWQGLSLKTLAGYPVPPWLGLPLAVGWLLMTTNALNLIDGLDGLCSGTALLAALTLFGAAYIQGGLPLEHATVPLAGALLGFLCHNSHPATVFLGDSGALTMGFLLGCYGLMWTNSTSFVFGASVPLLALFFPLLDMTLSIARRSLKGKPIFQADRGHVHHRLLDRGFNARQAVFILYLVTLAATGVTLGLAYPLNRWLHLLVVVTAIAVCWAGIRALRYPEFEVAGEWVFGGEFRRTLDTREKTGALVKALASSAGPQDWWEAMVRSAAPFRWTRVTLIRADRRYEHAYTAEPADWSFSIHLGGEDRLEIAGTEHSEKIDLLPLTSALRQSFFSQEWNKLALS